MSHKQKTLGLLLLGAVSMFVLGLLASKAMYGQPVDYDAPWWTFAIAGLLAVASAYGALENWKEHCIWERIRREISRARS